MNKSESIKNIAKAILIAQKNTGAAVKGSKNPFFKSNYSDLPTVMEVVKGAYNNAGISILQPTTHKEGKNFITTMLLHEDSGEYLSGDTEIVYPKLNDAQNFGSAQTYARRFGLQAMLFVPSEDDDGNAVSNRAASKPTAVASPVTTSVADPATMTPTVNTALATPVEKKNSSFRKGVAVVPATIVTSVVPETQAELWT